MWIQYSTTITTTTIISIFYADKTLNYYYYYADKVLNYYYYYVNYFNKPVSNIEGLVIEKVKSKDPFVLKEREQMYIRKFDTFKNGLNREH